ncbi:MAG: hypothetical protein L0Y71_13240 [Gemmataceae bacterium]|nr:hypothetical protein [Gemmataceae bacterium]
MLDLAPREITVEKGQRRVVRLYDPQRQAAEWALSLRGSVVAKVNGRPAQTIKDAKS